MSRNLWDVYVTSQSPGLIYGRVQKLVGKRSSFVWKFDYKKTPSSGDIVYLVQCDLRGPPKPANEVGVPKHVDQLIRSLSKIISSASNRKVRMPIDYFDPCGAKGQTDEAQCSADG